MTNVPVVVNPALIERHRPLDRDGKPINDEIFDALAEAVTAAQVFAARIAAAHDALMADETKTPAARLLESRKLAGKLAEQAARKIDSARAKAQAELAAIARETNAPPPPINHAEISLDVEIRQRLASMRSADRDRVISDALASGDDVVARAIFAGPAWLVGISNAERELKRHQWRARKFPGHVDREARIKKALGALDIIDKSMAKFFSELAETPAAKLAAAAAERAAAAAAAASTTKNNEGANAQPGA